MAVKHSYIIFSVIALLLVLTAFGFMIIPSSTPVNQGFDYSAEVCVYKNGELVECNHNTLYNTGAAAIKEDLGSGDSNSPFINISLCNATPPTACGTPVAAATEDFTALATGNLSQIAGTYGSTTDSGNYSIWYTFTSTATDATTINATRLHNSSGANFAGSTFSAVTLSSGDTLLINWSIGIA